MMDSHVISPEPHRTKMGESAGVTRVEDRPPIQPYDRKNVPADRVNDRVAYATRGPAFADGRDLVDLVDRACERGFDTGYVSFMENHKVGRAWNSLGDRWMPPKELLTTPTTTTMFSMISPGKNSENFRVQA